MNLRITFLKSFIYPLKSRAKSLFIERVQPYDYVGLFTIRYLDKFLHTSSNQIKRCCIVGVKYGFEIEPILSRYPEVFIDAFECSPRWLHHLQVFQKYSRVKVVPKAVSSTSGTSVFFETNLEGNGSLLRIGNLHKKWYSSYQTEEYQVETTTLDEYYRGTVLDLLWIDVQGAEKLVLLGATEVLKTVRAVFIEVTQKPDFYEGSATFPEISKLLEQSGLKPILLGMDFNLTGNALFLRGE